MFKLKMAEMHDNSIFVKYNLHPVQEDYYCIHNNIFCVADGVTRDDINGNPVRYPETEVEAKEWIKVYPKKSGAYESAKIVAEYFVNTAQSLSITSISKEEIKKIAIEANKQLIKLNANRKIDYLKDDYYGCVAVGGYITDNILYAFSIGDSRIVLLDKNYNILFESINNHKYFEDYSKNLHLDWKRKDDRILIRKDFRNNSNKIIDNKLVSFGVLTGEKTAEYFIDAYEINLENVKYICAFSDGCKDFFNSKESTKELLENLDIFKEKGEERTLIIYEQENY